MPGDGCMGTAQETAAAGLADLGVGTADPCHPGYDKSLFPKVEAEISFLAPRLDKQLT